MISLPLSEEETAASEAASARWVSVRDESAFLLEVSVCRLPLWVVWPLNIAKPAPASMRSVPSECKADAVICVWLPLCRRKSAAA